MGDEQQERVMAISRLGLACKHLSNAEDRIDDAVFYTLGLSNRPGNFTLEAEEINSTIIRLMTRARVLIENLRSGGPPPWEENDHLRR